MLALDMDPKLAWALAHRERFPVNLNTAPRELLLRVPGFGVQTVDRLLAARRVRRLRHADLARLQRRPRFRRYRAGVGGGATASADCTCPSSNTASASR